MTLLIVFSGLLSVALGSNQEGKHISSFIKQRLYLNATHHENLIHVLLVGFQERHSNCYRLHPFMIALGSTCTKALK